MFTPVRKAIPRINIMAEVLRFSGTARKFSRVIRILWAKLEAGNWKDSATIERTASPKEIVASDTATTPAKSA